MMKFLMIIGGIFLAVFLFLGWIVKKVRNIFMPFQQPQSAAGQANRTQQRAGSEGNVIYKKDDVVVMKGEAGKKNK